MSYDIDPKIEPETPWLGLRSFSESTRDYFYGRAQELEELFERVEHKLLTVLYGQSGLGKTSLLQAGLTPRLRGAGYLPVNVRLQYTEQDPLLTEQVLSKLSAALLSIQGPDLSRFSAEGVGLWELFHDPAFGLIARDGVAIVRPVFIFDQFEEIFTLGEKRNEDVAEFKILLANLVENRPPDRLRRQLEEIDDLADRFIFEARPFKVLLSLRDDFLNQLERWRRFMPSLMDSRFELCLLTGPKALQAAVEPGRRRVEKPPIINRDTAAAIVRFVAGASSVASLGEICAVQPPLLSLICAEMNDQRLKAGSDCIETDQLLGRSEDILRTFYERCFEVRPAAFRELIEDRLLSTEGHRESLSLDSVLHELKDRGLEVSEADDAINGLVDNRLLVVEERGGVRRIELTHDILTGVVRRSRDQRRQLEAKEKKEQAEAREREANRKLARERRRTAVLAVACCFAMLALGVALFYYYKAKNANTRAENAAYIAQENEQLAQHNEAISNQRLADSLEESGGHLLSEQNDYERALIYLNEAYKIDPKRPTLNLLLARAIAPFEAAVGTLAGHRSAIIAAAFTPDGKRIATASADATAKIWDAGSLRLIDSLDGHATAVACLDFNADGSLLLTGSRDGEVRIWNTATFQLVNRVKAHNIGVNFAGFTGDGKAFVTVSFDQTAALWDVVSGQRLAQLILDHGPPSVASMDAKRKRLLVGSSDGTAVVWQLEGDRSVMALGGDHHMPLTATVFSSDGKSILTAGLDGTANLWDATSGMHRLALPAASDSSEIIAAEFHPRGDRLLTATAAGVVKVFAVNDGHATVSLAIPGHLDAARFTADGVGIVTMEDSGAVQIWDVTTGTSLTRFTKHNRAVLGAVFSPSKDVMVTFCRDSVGRVWDLRAAGLPRVLPLAAPLTTLCFRRSAHLGLCHGPRIARFAWPQHCRSLPGICQRRRFFGQRRRG